LFEFSQIVTSFTTDSGAKHSGEEFLERFNTVLGENKADFNVIRYLRHRKSHGSSYSGLKDKEKQRIHQEWVTAKKWAKNCLGWVWSWNKKAGPRTTFFDDDRDMHITPHEGTQIKLSLLKAANEALQKLQPPKS
jgi:hypothetical protein